MQKNILCRVKSQDCCGCGACANKCPVKAISMRENEEGFLAPAIDENLCTDCGLCAKACPALNVRYENTTEPECYAAMAEDEIRMKSSSGGIFSLLAEHIIDKGGYICGAAFNKDWSVSHIIIDNKQDLAKLRGSKYVQSDIENCYRETKKLLDAGKEVLFSGCPCQIAGLYSFLGKKYKQLITIDLVCHGTPSRKVWRKYLEENFDISKITKIDFRDKSFFGWATTMNIYFKNKTTEYHKDAQSDPYFKGFIPCLLSNKHCGKCFYTKLPRQGDISLADWWGIDNFQKGLNDNKGTSQILINSDKGKKLYSNIIPHLKKNYNIGLQTTLKSINKTIYKPFPLHYNRERFFKNINKYPVTKNISDCIENKYDVCLITTFFAQNYGAILVAYAVNRLLEKLGFSVLMLQKPADVWPGYPLGNTIPMNFARKHYNISGIYADEEDMIRLNGRCDTFVVGSDQIFNPGLHLNYSFLDFVENQKKKIAFATSFGHDEYNEKETDIIKRKYLLKRFSHIALREKTANLCENIFAIKADEVIDPTLMLSQEDYDKVIGDTKSDISSPYLLTYMLDMSKEKEEAVRYIADKFSLQIINIPNLEEKHRRPCEMDYLENVTPEIFLYLYKHASFVITDSYHGTCFAVKFNRQFISFINNFRGSLRYRIFDCLKLNNRIFSDPQHIFSSPDVMKLIDFTEANNLLEKWGGYAINWLKDAISSPVSNPIKYTDFENYMDIKIKENALLNKQLKSEKEKMETELKQLQEQTMLLSNASAVRFRYYRCKMLSKLLWGAKRRHYRKKAEALHQKLRKIRRIKKQLRNIR